MTALTRIFERINQGEANAVDDLWRVVYEELRSLAAVKMANQAPGNTLQVTALVNEAWLRLGADAQPAWKNRAHFFAAAAQAMRCILVDHARKRMSVKRGSGAVRVDLDEVEFEIPLGRDADEKLLAVDEAIEKFAAVEPRKAELVRLRYFTGLTFEETAAVLGIAVPTAKEWWAYARAWLLVELKRSA